MQFHPASRIGKAGERRFASIVEERLGFVFRGITSPDIGIDGEIEMLDPSGSATGGLIKVQIKAIDRAPERARFRVALDEGHLDYFASLTVPPILALVCLEADTIWWKPVLDKAEYAGPRGGFGIPFDLHRDRLTARSAAALRLLAERSNGIIAGSLVDVVSQSLIEMDDAVEAGRFDLFEVDHWAFLIRGHERAMREADCLFKHERRRTPEIIALQESYDDVADRLAERKQWFDDYDCGDLLREPRWGDGD